MKMTWSSSYLQSLLSASILLLCSPANLP